MRMGKAKQTETIKEKKQMLITKTAGLRVLLSAQMLLSRQGSMSVRNVNSEVMDVFELTGFSDILAIE